MYDKNDIYTVLIYSVRAVYDVNIRRCRGEQCSCIQMTVLFFQTYRYMISWVGIYRVKYFGAASSGDERSDQ